MANPNVLLIDADILCFSTCSSSEVDCRFDEDTHVLYSKFSVCVQKVEDRVKKLVEKLEGDKVIMCFSDSSNFRTGVFSGYKNNRKGLRKPLALKRLREYVAEKYTSKTLPGLEGDDVMGILATSNGKVLPGKKIIVSIDKDMGGIPGWYFNENKHTEAVQVTLEDANRQFFTQVLTGDRTDGYPGCDGIGPVAASKILDGLDMLNEKAVWEAIVKAYAKAGYTEEYTLNQARCARILRASDYDMKTNTVKPWNPKLID